MLSTYQPIECRETKTKAITMTNHNKRKQQIEPMTIQGKNTLTDAKHGKTHVIKSRLVLVLHLGLVVQRMDNAIHRINRYRTDNVVCFVTLKNWIAI